MLDGMFAIFEQPSMSIVLEFVNDEFIRWIHIYENLANIWKSLGSLLIVLDSRLASYIRIYRKTITEI